MTESEIRSLIETQRKYFHTGVTFPVKTRIENLKKLKAAVLAHEEEINKAYHDLNPDCDKTHVATIGELRECIRVNKMQKIELISTIKENGEYFRFIVEDQKMFHTLLEEIINDINLLPNIYDIRNGV